MCDTNQFRRVESTSSFKRLPKLSNVADIGSENAEVSGEKTFEINSSMNPHDDRKNVMGKPSASIIILI